MNTPCIYRVSDQLAQDPYVLSRQVATLLTVSNWARTIARFFRSLDHVLFLPQKEKTLFKQSIIPSSQEVTLAGRMQILHQPPATILQSTHIRLLIKIKEKIYSRAKGYAMFIMLDGNYLFCFTVNSCACPLRRVQHTWGLDFFISSNVFCIDCSMEEWVDGEETMRKLCGNWRVYLQ